MGDGSSTTPVGMAIFHSITDLGPSGPATVSNRRRECGEVEELAKLSPTRRDIAPMVTLDLLLARVVARDMSSSPNRTRSSLGLSLAHLSFDRLRFPSKSSAPLV